MSTHPSDTAERIPSNNLNRQVGLYSLAAAVAGVSMLALAEPAQAEVVVTKKTIPIPMVPFQTVGPVRISMANNGINNFGFNLYNESNSMISDRGVGVWGVSAQDGVMVGGSFYAKALALARGSEIGPSESFFDGSSLALIEGSEVFSSNRTFRGFWQDSKNRYLGVSFPINGETHYGWIRLTVTTDPNAHGAFMSAKITGYAYETVANKPILAGTAKAAPAAAKPASELGTPQNIQQKRGPSLGMLATGSEALPLWRREETAAHQ